MKLITSLFCLLLSSSAFAGPCNDEIYSCTSRSYKIEITHCIDANNMGGSVAIDPAGKNGFTLEINGKKVTDASLTAEWDGPTFGAFELSLPSKGELERHLSVEFLISSGAGTLRYQTRDGDPAVFKTVHAEKIRCAVQ